ncbi:SET domain-containing protein [Ganoderma leucocontextum]|nr:SET domain-containing protein [Ganoderma leucocontextum]
MSDHEYSPSPSPEEDWGESDREWVVDGIVGESIDAFGQKRYEVKWGEGWKRKDNTNTTWEHPREDLAELIKEWDQKQAAKRMAKAKASPAMEIGVEDWHMLHEDRTIERARGYEELKKLYIADEPGSSDDPRRPIDFDGQLKRLKPVSNATRQASSKTLSSRSTSAARTSREASREKSRSNTPGSASLAPGPSHRPVKPLPKRTARRLVSSPVPDSEDEKEHTTGSRTPPRTMGGRMRMALEKKWTQSMDGAAPVTFVNDVTQESIPSLVPNFQYLERHYVYADGTRMSEDQKAFLVGCECEELCLEADKCECQKESGLQNGGGHQTFAYTRKQKLFNFELPPGMEVIECNENCSCEAACPNRVAQLPRDAPIEIFQTRTHGWGARATVPLKRGKVLGIYTGYRPRAVAEKRQESGHERKSYIFDLDVREGGDDGIDDDPTGTYSVDGYAHGNWTRFVNHSCEPNMQVVPVVWDTIPELKQPYLAFVAAQDIPARTELTIDYDPQGALEPQDDKGKLVQARPEGARECTCGTDSCRGWVRV